jgi:hypothetical protein
MWKFGDLTKNGWDKRRQQKWYHQQSDIVKEEEKCLTDSSVEDFIPHTTSPVPKFITQTTPTPSKSTLTFFQNMTPTAFQTPNPTHPPPPRSTSLFTKKYEPLHLPLSLSPSLKSIISDFRVHSEEELSKSLHLRKSIHARVIAVERNLRLGLRDASKENLLNRSDKALQELVEMIYLVREVFDRVKFFEGLWLGKGSVAESWVVLKRKLEGMQNRIEGYRVRVAGKQREINRMHREVYELKMQNEQQRREIERLKRRGRH